MFVLLLIQVCGVSGVLPGYITTCFAAELPHHSLCINMSSLSGSHLEWISQIPWQESWYRLKGSSFGLHALQLDLERSTKDVVPSAQYPNRQYSFRNSKICSGHALLCVQHILEGVWQPTIIALCALLWV